MSNKYLSWGWFQADNGRYGVKLEWQSGGWEYHHNISPSSKYSYAIRKAFRNMEFMKFASIPLSIMPDYVRKQLIEKAGIDPDKIVDGK